MKIYFKLGVPIIVVLICYIFVDQLHANLASPPPQLTTILEDFTDFEHKFKSGKWDGALKSVDRISETFNKMQRQLKEDIKADPEAGFLKIMTGLKQAVRKKDNKDTEEYFIQLQSFMFALISNYEYKVPPVLTLMNKYIAEAEEALKRNDFKRIESEMDEILSLFYYAESYLEGRGANHRKIESVKDVLRKIRIAGIEKQKQTAQNGIHSLKKLMTELFGK